MELALVFIVIFWTFTGGDGTGEFVGEPWTSMVENFNIILKRIEGNYGKKDLVDGIMIDSLEHAISKDCKDGLIKEIDEPYPTEVPGVFSKLYVLANPRDQVEEQLFWILPSVDCNPQTTAYEKPKDQPSTKDKSVSLFLLPVTAPASIPQSLEHGYTKTADLKINKPPPIKPTSRYLLVESPGGDKMIAVKSPFKLSPPLTRSSKLKKKESNPSPPEKLTPFFRDLQAKHNHDKRHSKSPSGTNYGNAKRNSQENKYDPQHTTENSFPFNEKVKEPTSVFEKSLETHIPPLSVPDTSVPEYHNLLNPNPTSERDKMSGFVNSNSPPPIQTIPKHITMEDPTGDNRLELRASPYKSDPQKTTQLAQTNDKVSNPVHQEKPTSPMRDYRAKQNPDEANKGHNPQVGESYRNDKIYKPKRSYDPRDLPQSPTFEKAEPPKVPTDSHYNIPPTESRPYDQITDIGYKIIPYPTPVNNQGKDGFGKLLPTRSSYKPLPDLHTPPIIPGSSTDGQRGEQDHKESKELPADKVGSFMKGPFGVGSPVNPILLSEKESKYGTSDPIEESELKSSPSTIRFPHNPSDHENGEQPHHLRTQDKPNVKPPQYEPETLMSTQHSIKSDDTNSESRGDSESDESSSGEQTTAGTVQQPEHTPVNKDQDKKTPNTKTLQQPTKPSPLRPVLSKDDQFNDFIDRIRKRWAHEKYDNDR